MRLCSGTYFRSGHALAHAVAATLLATLVWSTRVGAQTATAPTATPEPATLAPARTSASPRTEQATTPFVIQAHTGLHHFLSTGLGSAWTVGASMELKWDRVEGVSMAVGATVDANLDTARRNAVDFLRLMARVRVRIPVWSRGDFRLAVVPLLHLGIGAFFGLAPGANFGFVSEVAAEVRGHLDPAFYVWLRPIAFSFNYLPVWDSFEVGYAPMLGVGWYFQ